MKKTPDRLASLTSISIGKALIIYLAAAFCADSAIAQADTSEYFEDAHQYYATRNLPEALIQLKNALKLNNQHVPSLLLLGDIYTQRGEVHLAEQAYSEALLAGASPDVTAPKLADTLLLQGSYRELIGNVNTNGLTARARGSVLAYQAIAQLKLGNEIESRVLLNQANALAPSDRATRIARAESALVQRDTSLALQETSELVKNYPEDARLWALRGAALTAGSAKDAALDAYSRAIAINARLVTARLGRAQLHLNASDYDTASIDLEYLAAKFSGDPRASYLLAEVARRQGKPDKARAEFERASNAVSLFDEETVAADRELTLIAANSAIALNATERGLQALTAFQSGHPKELGTGVLLAKLLLQSGEPTAALRVTEPLLSNEPGDNRLLALKAQALSGLERYEDAAQIWRRLGSGAPAPEISSSLAVNELMAGRISAGIANLEKVLADTPDREQDIYQLASAYLQAERLDDAAASVRQLLSLNSAQWQYHLLLAEIQMQQNRPDAAETTLATQIERSPDITALGVARARAMAAQSQISSARDVLIALETSAPEDISVKVQLARLAQIAGDLAAARRYAEQARALDFTNIAAASVLTDVLLGLDENTEAVASARDVANRDPESTQAQLLLASTFARTGDRAGAIAQYKILSRRSNLPAEVLYRIAAAQSQLGALEDASAVLYTARRQAPDQRDYQLASIDVALRLGHIETGLTDAIELARNNPEHAPSVILLGRAQQASGDYRAAAQTFADALALSPDNSNICLQRYRALKAGQQELKASRLLRSWVDEHPTDQLVGFALSRELTAAGRLSEAKRLLSSLLTLTPSNPVLLNNLAGVQLRLGESGAVATAKLAHAVAPTSPEINDTLGWALTQNGKASEGLTYLREAVARSAVAPELRYHLGAALHVLGRTQEAAYELRAALESDRSFEGREHAQKLLESQRDR